MNNKVYIIIPAYNEEKKISKVIDNVLLKYENVIIVDDCSSDNTLEIVKNKNVILLHHIINRGQGAALETGTKKAMELGAEVFVHFDADGQFLAEDIEKIIHPIIKGEAEIVFGSRFLDNKTNLPFTKKYLIMPVARFILKKIYKSSLTDPQNGFRAFSRKVAKELNIDNDGAAHCTEIINKAHKNKWKIKEVPITVNYDDFGQGVFSGKGRGTGGVKILIDLFINKLIS